MDRRSSYGMVLWGFLLLNGLLCLVPHSGAEDTPAQSEQPELAIYQATALLQINLEDEDNLAEYPKPTMAMLEQWAYSEALLSEVVERLTDAEAAALIAPYEMTIEETTSLLHQNLRAKPFQGAPNRDVFWIAFQHPDPHLAAKVANTVADELITFQVRRNIEYSIRQVEEKRDELDINESLLTAMKHAVKDPKRDDLVRLNKDIKLQQAKCDRLLEELQTKMTRIGPTITWSIRFLEKAQPPTAPLATFSLTPANESSNDAKPSADIGKVAQSHATSQRDVGH
ncbi:MAG: hypothetical protein ACQKBV_09245 [Puniceicoccales bacterium]